MVITHDKLQHGKILKMISFGLRDTDNNYIDKDLIAGDWVYVSHNSDLVEIISEEEFEKYWEKDDER